MNWKHRHTIITVLWALAAVVQTDATTMAGLFGAMVGAFGTALLFVFILGSLWQRSVRAVRRWRGSDGEADPEPVAG